MSSMDLGKNTALLVVDVQKALFQKPVPIYQEEKVLNAIKLMLRFSKEHQLLRVFIQHNNASFLKKGTDGWQLHPSLSQTAGDIFIDKTHGNAFEDTPLKQILEKNQITKVIICGLVSHGCVKATAIGACQLGYQVILIEDAHSNYQKDAALLIEETNESLKAAGCTVIATNQVLS